MFVQQILTEKASAKVATLTPDASLRAAVEMMSQRRIGAVIISPDGRQVDGIVSERDLVHKMAHQGPECLDHPVTQIMTRHVIGCAPTDTADTVMEQMTQGRFRHMPVMEDGEMVGLISIGDVVKARLTELAMEKDALEGMIKGF